MTPATLVIGQNSTGSQGPIKSQHPPCVKHRETWTKIPAESPVEDLWNPRQLRGRTRRNLPPARPGSRDPGEDYERRLGVAVNASSPSVGPLIKLSGDVGTAAGRGRRAEEKIESLSQISSQFDGKWICPRISGAEERSNLARATARLFWLWLWLAGFSARRGRDPHTERARIAPIRPAYARRSGVESAKACAMPDLLCSLGTIRVRRLLDRRASSPL